MARIRSRMARRGKTGRKPNTLKRVRRRVHVHHHRHRRYAGTRGGNAAPKRRRNGIAGSSKRVMRKGLHRKFKGRRKSTHKRVMRKGLHRRFLGRKKSLHKRVMRKGLHRKFKGRKYHGRHVKPGQHRRFFGRKPSTHRPRISKPKPKTTPISAASYLSMF